MNKQEQKDSPYKREPIPIEELKLLKTLDSIRDRNGELPKSLELVRNSHHLLSSIPKDRLKKISNILSALSSADEKQLLTILNFLEMLHNKKKECDLAEQRRLSTEAVRNRRYKLFYVLRPYLIEIDSKWALSRGPVEGLSKADAIKKVWDEKKDEIVTKLYEYGLKKTYMTQNILAKRFEEYVHVYAFWRSKMPSGRRPRNNKNGPTHENIGDRPVEIQHKWHYLSMDILGIPVLPALTTWYDDFDNENDL